MFTGLLHLHSFLRWVLLLLLIIGLIKAYAGWLGKKPFTAGDKKIHLFLMIAAHVQLLIGIVVYSMSSIVSYGISNMSEAMKEPSLRFWTVEHIAAMVIAIVLITIGRSKSKKAALDVNKHMFPAIFYTIAILIILWAIPWVERGWF
jgi:uncharacterized membrane protein